MGLERRNKCSQSGALRDCDGDMWTEESGTSALRTRGSEEKPKKTHELREGVPCLRSHGWWVAEAGFGRGLGDLGVRFLPSMLASTHRLASPIGLPEAP